MDLYNVKTGKKELINDPAQLNDAILTGSHAFKKGSMVNVYPPDSDDRAELKQVPAENLADAIKMGYKVQTQQRKGIDDYLEENSGLTGAAKVALGQFADEALMGVPETALDILQDPEEVAKREALKKEHKATNAIAGVLGFGASMLYGGPLFKGASKAGAYAAEKVAAKLGAEAIESGSARGLKKLATDIVSKASGSAVEGAILASPRAVTEAALGEPTDAAETLAEGIGAGALFGSAGALANPFKKVAKSAIEKTAALTQLDQFVKQDAKTLGRKFAVRALNPTTSQVEKLRALEETFVDGQLTKLTPTQKLDLIGKDLLDEGILDGMPSHSTMLERLQEKTGEYAAKVGDALDSFNQYGESALIPTSEVVDRVKAKIGANSKLSDPANFNLKDQFDSWLEQYAAKAQPFLTMREANASKAVLQEKVKSAYINTEDANIKSYLKEIPETINEVIREKARALNPEVADTLIKSQAKLGNLMQAEAISAKAAAKETSLNKIGLTGYLAGVAGLSYADPILGLSLLAGRELQRRYGDQVLAKALARNQGILFAEQAMKRSAESMDALPKILERMSLNKPEISPRQAALYGTLKLIPDFRDKYKEHPEDKPVSYEDRVKAIEKLNEDTEWLISNPDHLSEKLTEITEPLKEGGAPQIAEATGNQYIKALNYISNNIPKPKKVDSIFKRDIKWKPSDYDMAIFEKKMDVLQNPFIVLKELENNTLTRAHMHALKEVYPSIHQKMQQRVFQTLADKKFPLDYNKRIKLSLLMDAPLDETLKSIPYYQQTWAAENSTMAQSESNMAMPGEPGYKASVDVANMEFSEMDARNLRRMN